MPNIHQKIAEVKHQFHKLKLEKTGHNKFAGYYYFELADFLLPALALMHEHGLSEITSFTEDQASMTIIDVDKPEDTVTITSPFSSANLKACHPVQNVGACETYQRRYLWTAFLQIAEHDAIDSAPAAEPVKPAEPTIADRVRRAIDAYSKCNTDARLTQLDSHIEALIAEATKTQCAAITAARDAAVERVNAAAEPAKAF